MACIRENKQIDIKALSEGLLGTMGVCQVVSLSIFRYFSYGILPGKQVISEMPRII